MYSVVLMVALTGGADVPALGHHGCHGCHGCYGCSGYCSGWYGGCSGYCSGWYGGCHGCHGGLFHRHSCHGCHGCSGCSGGYCSGWYGGCSGYCGGWYGGCSGYSGGCSGYSGGCYGSAITYDGGAGCYGGAVITDGGYYGTPVAPKKITDGERPEKVKQPKKTTDEGDEVSLPAPATITVSLPAAAKLTVDGYLTTSTSSVRTLTSPALEPGREYVYNLQAEMVRDGKPVTTSKEITVRAGDELNVNLAFPEQVAQK